VRVYYSHLLEAPGKLGPAQAPGAAEAGAGATRSFWERAAVASTSVALRLLIARRNIPHKTQCRISIGHMKLSQDRGDVSAHGYL
jgi:predicted cobalt transporter CbtA